MRLAAARAAVFLLSLCSAVASGTSAVRADYHESARWFSAKTEADRIFLQSMLILVGHYEGLIDGVFGRTTYDAIVEYEAEQRINADGVLTPDDEQRLRAAATAVYDGLGFSDQTDAATGIKILVPAKLFTAHRPSNFGTHWESDDNGIELESLAIPEAQSSFAQLLARLSHGRDRKVEYSFVRDSVFVLSGEIGERKFYTLFVRSAGVSHGFSVSWTKADDSVGRMVSAFLASVVQFPTASDFAASPSEAPRESKPTTVSAGSGFAISNDGVIVTNAHVVEGCTAVDVLGFGPGKLITVDKRNDFAVIQLTNGHPAAAATIQTGKLELGRRSSCWAIHCPT